jgi:hypothetical protein
MDPGTDEQDSRCLSLIWPISAKENSERQEGYDEPVPKERVQGQLRILKRNKLRQRKRARQKKPLYLVPYSQREVKERKNYETDKNIVCVCRALFLLNSFRKGT